jgi:N-acetylglucosaminyldiphosphoundecaprenol N-acetyl-beta-D-mannosaminyltransferase
MGEFDRSDYIRKVDKSKIPTCNILGVELAAVDMEWTMEFLKKNINNLSGDYICVSNVHTTMMSYDDPKYRTIQNLGIMALPDGGPLSSVGKQRGYERMGRVAGPDLMDEIFKISVDNGYRHYFYGSTEKTLQKLRGNLQKGYPGLQIVGMYSPPFRSITDEEDEQIVKAINDENPDLVWIGLGAPKQEKWMAAHQGKVKGLMIGVGAGFDYFAGNIKRAPEFMRNSNLEWFFRLIQEPKRLLKRYLITNTKFIWLVVRRK